MRRVTCPCGAKFEARSTRAVYCSQACRKRGSRAGVSVSRSTTAAVPSPAAEAAVEAAGELERTSVTAAVIAELDEANALGSASGLAAVKLAQLIDSATLMQGASVAAWTKELRALIDRATETAPTAEVDPIDEIERKRRERRGA